MDYSYVRIMAYLALWALGRATDIQSPSSFLFLSLSTDHIILFSSWLSELELQNI